MSDIYLAFVPDFNIESSVRKIGYITDYPGKVKPNVLISFFYLRKLELAKQMSVFKGHKLMLDSGAYSAYNSHKIINIEELIAESKNPTWGESVCLDVIGDEKASLKNSLYMREKGSPAFPVFHIGDDWKILKEYCEKFTKVGLSCRFGEPVNDSLDWLAECFAHQWPHKFHSFGWVEETMLMRFPFHSADSSSWEAGPYAFGRWRSLNIIGRSGEQKIDSRAHSLAPEIAHYLKLQAKLKLRWAVEIKKHGWDK